MNQSNFLRKHSISLLALVIATIFSPAMATHYLATWTNGNSTEIWSDAANWDIGVVPVNDTDTFDVVIAAGFTVYFDIDTASTVTDLELAVTSTLVINPGHSLAVLDDAVVNGKVIAEGASTDFTCASAGAVLGDNTLLDVSGGATIESAAVDYSSTINSNITLLSADGNNSLLDLSSLQSLNAAFGYSYRTHTISATNYGVIDMAWLSSIHGPTHSTSRLKLHVGQNGFINLFHLADILSGYTTFDIDAGFYSLSALVTATGTTFDASGTTTISLPILDTLDNTSLVIADGGAINAPQLTTFTNSQITLDPAYTFTTGPLSNIDNSRIALTGGQQFGTAFGDITMTDYTNTVNGNYTLFSASGIGTLFDLSSLTTINAAWGHSYRTQTISAFDQGVIDLSEVSIIYAPTHSTSRLKFHADSEGQIDLSSLLELPSGYSHFDIDVPGFTLPALQTGSGVTLDASSITTFDAPALTDLDNSSIVIATGGTINAPQLTTFTNSQVTLDPAYTLVTGSLSNIDDSRIALTGGMQFGTLYGDVTASDYTSTVNGNYTLFSASGIGTLFDLSSLTAINAGWGHSYRTQTISAVDQGVIDLSEVSVIYAPTHSTSKLVVHADSEGDIDLSSLLDIPSGYSRFDIDVPAYSLPALQTGTGVTFDASNVTTIDLPELTSLENSSIVIADGGIVNAPQLTNFTNSLATMSPAYTFVTGPLNDIDNSRIAVIGGVEYGSAYGDITAIDYTNTVSGNYTLFSASGAGTLFDLSSFNTLNAGWGHSYRTQTISAVDQAVIDFSSVGNLYGPTHSTSRLKMIVNSGAQMLFGENLSIYNYTSFELNGPDSTISIAGSFNLNAPAMLSAVEGSNIVIGGDFVYDLTNEAAFNLDSAFVTMNGSQAILEVAGQDLGLNDTGGVNFGFAQLTVGQSPSPTTLTLVDLVDNGNQAGIGEAMYLYGSGGLDGLKIGPGSKLIIGDINLYVDVDGQMVHINSLFGPGVKWIPFDEGIITLSDYSCSLAADLNGDCFVDLGDFAIMASEWLQCGDDQCD